MKKWLNNISKRTWMRVLLIAILFVLVAFSFVGEKVAMNNGIGWDGVNYLRTMEHFISLIKHHGYDQYEIMRVMPWGLTDILCVITGISVTRKVAIASGILYNSIAIVLGVFFFFQLSNLKQWKIETEVLGFSFLFYTYPVLKLMGYYPVLSDIFGLTIGIMLCYYFFANKRWALILMGLAGTFIWPTTPMVAFALAFFPRKPLPVGDSANLKDGMLLNYFVFLIATLPLLILVFSVVQYHGHIMHAMREILPLTIPIYKWIIPIACLCSCLYYYYIVSSFKVSFVGTLRDNFTGKQNWINYACFFALMLLTSGVSRLLANANPGALTTTQTLQCISLSSMTDPFVFVESHFIYYGIGYLFVLLLWKDVAKIIMQQGIGYLFAVAMWVLFSIRPEARVSIMFYVFPLITLLIYINTKQISSLVAVIGACFMLIHSRFWYRINVPNMKYYFDWENYEHYLDFPAQRYFMSQGHWQSHEMYAVWMVVTIIIGALLYWGIRKKWYVKEEID